ncbi:MAG: murein biosynthesis integral membrane protein MurJ [Rhodobiaceae bacterium]|nr:murein biosynthesis integral membrane protein MurJ [Rhodobiaceae bacterium]
MNIFKTSFNIAIVTLISRLLGFFRDILIAAILGTGIIADAFFMAFKFPNIFRRLFAEGAFSAAFIPIFSKKLTVSKLDAKKFASETASALFWFLLLLITIAELFMPFIVYVIAPGFIEDTEKFNLTITLTRIAFPYLLFMSLVALISGILNSIGKFTAAASLPIVLNTVLIFFLIIIKELNIPNTPVAAKYLISGVFISGALQLLLIVYVCKKTEYLPNIRIPKLTPDVKKFLFLGFPAIIAGGITQINLLIGSIIASFENGAISYLYYADRIYQLPLALIGITIGTVLLPELSRNYKAKDFAKASFSQNRAIELSLVLAIPATFGMIILSSDIIHVLFERGYFTSADTLATSHALIAFSYGLPAFILIKILQSNFFAKENTITPMWFSLISAIINIILSIILFKKIGFVGIAISTSISAWANTILLLLAISRTKDIIFDYRIKINFLLAIICSLIMLVSLSFVKKNILVIEEYFYSDLYSFLILSFYVLIGIIIYWIMAHIMGLLNTKKND